MLDLLRFTVFFVPGHSTLAVHIQDCWRRILTELESFEPKLCPRIQETQRVFPNLTDEKPLRSYADWAGDLDTNRSTPGNIVYLWGAPVAWCCMFVK